jgi:hypothetical protein
MRNNTKIKNVLIRFDLQLTMKDEKQIEIKLTDKWQNEHTIFSGKSLTSLIDNAHRYLMIKTKESEKG